MVKCYRKKPIVIEAAQWDGSLLSYYKIIKAFSDLQTVCLELDGNVVRCWKIKTLEGNHEVSPGDFIVRGIKGEYYPVKPDIFEKTYEEVNCENDSLNG